MLTKVKEVSEKILKNEGEQIMSDKIKELEAELKKLENREFYIQMADFQSSKKRRKLMEIWERMHKIDEELGRLRKHKTASVQ